MCFIYLFFIVFEMEMEKTFEGSRSVLDLYLDYEKFHFVVIQGYYTKYFTSTDTWELSIHVGASH